MPCGEVRSSTDECDLILRDISAIDDAEVVIYTNLAIEARQTVQALVDQVPRLVRDMLVEGHL